MLNYQNLLDLAARFCIFGKTQAMNKRFTLLLLFVVAPTLCLWPQKFLTQAEIYDFEPGDEFHTIRYYCCNDLTFQLEVTRVTKRFLDQGTLGYVLRKDLYDYLNTHPPVLSDTSIFGLTDTLLVAYPDSIMFDNLDTATVSPDLYNGRITCSDYFWFTNTLGLVRYTAGCGKVLQAWKMAFDSTFYVSDSLVYYKKGSEHWGQTLLAENETVVLHEFILSPNPVNHDLNIKILQEQLQVSYARVYNSQGQFICALPGCNPCQSFQLDCTHLKSGAYFIYFSTNKGKLVRKFIKR